MTASIKGDDEQKTSNEVITLSVATFLFFIYVEMKQILKSFRSQIPQIMYMLCCVCVCVCISCLIRQLLKRKKERPCTWSCPLRRRIVILHHLKKSFLFLYQMYETWANGNNIFYFAFTLIILDSLCPGGCRLLCARTLANALLYQSRRKKIVK